MKNLCICCYGHSRSVALARMFHEQKQPAVAIGYTTAGPEALAILSKWADRIFLMTPEALSLIPPSEKNKVIIFDIGPDRWSNPYDPDLAETIRQHYQRFLQETGSSV